MKAPIRWFEDDAALSGAERKVLIAASAMVPSAELAQTILSALSVRLPPNALDADIIPTVDEAPTWDDAPWDQTPTFDEVIPDGSPTCGPTTGVDELPRFGSRPSGGPPLSGVRPRPPEFRPPPSAPRPPAARALKASAVGRAAGWSAIVAAVATGGLLYLREPPQERPSAQQPRGLSTESPKLSPINEMPSAFAMDAPVLVTDPPATAGSQPVQETNRPAEVRARRTPGTDALHTTPQTVQIAPSASSRSALEGALGTTGQDERRSRPIPGQFGPKSSTDMPSKQGIDTAPVLSDRGASPEDPGILESRAVAEARIMLRRGNASGALLLLDRVRTTYPNGVLAQEREALAIEALLAKGARAAAKRRAAQFLEHYANSPHAASVRRALE